MSINSYISKVDLLSSTNIGNATYKHSCTSISDDSKSAFQLRYILETTITNSGTSVWPSL